MDKFALFSAKERREIIQERATQMGVDFTIVEKDFWVCWTLKSLFALPGGNPSMTFKGGTSLSKAYGLIDRFSEDIDIATDLHFFLTQGVLDPEEPGISNTQRGKRIEYLDSACAAYVGEQLLSTLGSQFDARLRESNAWDLLVDRDDPNTLLFHYPKSDPTIVYGYLRDTVKIELGWKARTAPHELKIVAPYLAEIPMLLEEPQVSVSVLTPDRTFWEKVTALHAESFRATPKQFFSRHYYDVAAMLQTKTGQLASSDLAMLEDVRAFKEIYYPASWARYDLAKPGSLVVVPDEKMLRDLAIDYRNMRQMFLSDPPSFDSVLDRLKAFEQGANR
ncbi:MAG TPA: nucleotidyl transferase AbiEii/AbiGii toxin family protein [Candidatus Acidoferrales bacterium]|nr:nucleotidyl transferase AbiEii/AbiGii toxin family protein [Candidatus Acidoferrales bacterium]